MKRPLPTVAELAVFAALALACAAAATLTRVHDLAMAVLALPIFIFAAVVGMRRSGQWAAIGQSAADPQEPESGDPDAGPAAAAAAADEEEAAA